MTGLRKQYFPFSCVRSSLQKRGTDVNLKVISSITGHCSFYSNRNKCIMFGTTSRSLPSLYCFLITGVIRDGQATAATWKRSRLCPPWHPHQRTYSWVIKTCTSLLVSVKPSPLSLFAYLVNVSAVHQGDVLSCLDSVYVGIAIGLLLLAAGVAVCLLALCKQRCLSMWVLATIMTLRLV